MGVKASSLILIDMLKGMCGGGMDVPLTENDIFNENGEIVDDKFDEYLMQQDDEDEAKKKVFIALASMVGSTVLNYYCSFVHSARRTKVGIHAIAEAWLALSKLFLEFICVCCLQKIFTHVCCFRILFMAAYVLKDKFKGKLQSSPHLSLKI